MWAGKIKSRTKGKSSAASMKQGETMLGLVKRQCGWAERGSGGPLKHRDCGVVEKEVFI